MTCGPRALYSAALRLGVPVTRRDIAERLPLTENGTTLLAIKRIAEEYGMAPTAKSLAWDALRAHDGVAILHVSGDHFILVDPREKGTEKMVSSVRVYDHGCAEWWSQKHLQAAWRGPALLLRRGNALSNGRRSALQFETLLIDFGARDQSQGVDVSFSAQNTGQVPLHITRVSSDCGCVVVRQPCEKLLPGEMAEVVARVKLENRRGVLEKHIFVRTSDPAHPCQMLTIQGRVMGAPIVSDDSLALGVVERGAKVERHIVIHTFGREDTSIVTCEASLGVDNKLVAPGTKIRASYRPWDASRPFEKSRAGQVSQGVPGDYVVEVSVGISPNERQGSAAGQIAIVTRNVVDEKRITIPVSFCVPSRAAVDPQVLLFLVRAGSDESLVRDVAIDAPDDLAITSIDAKGVPLEVQLVQGVNRGLRVKYKPQSQVAGNMLGNVVCSFDDGTTVDIPCQVVREQEVRR